MEVLNFLAIYSILLTLAVVIALYPFVYEDSYSSMHGMLTKSEIESARESAREMFYFAYDNYMSYAYPKDELDPIHCVGRGHDHDNPSNINVNDALGDYSLSLVESLDSLVVLGNKTEFHKAVQLVIQNLSFERNVTVQVFEATIRIIGSLLSAHLILTDENHLLGNYRLEGYDNELLTLAHDLANRLLYAFERTGTGLPYPRVNLLKGVSEDTINETCTAGAGSLLLEFGIISRLLKDPSFENAARRTVAKLWRLRNNATGLIGNVVNIQTGYWRGVNSGVGAGIDSFYEYLLKSYILFGDSADLKLFQEAYKLIMVHMRRGRDDCINGHGDPPLFVNIDMRDGSMLNTWIDSLQASFAAVLVLNGNIDEAICLHAIYYTLWKKYDAIPERFNWYLKRPEVFFYPLRPEFIESTYMLYRATKNPFYMHVGLQILRSLNMFTRVKCGYATIHNVIDKTLEDRMESFFLSETAKYLFLLFDVENVVNRNEAKILFTTEGHIVVIDERLRDFGEENLFIRNDNLHRTYSSGKNNSIASCHRVYISNGEPPLDEYRFSQLVHLTGP